MPVVNLFIDKLAQFFPGKDLGEILEVLPYVGLDIESVDSHVIRIEYNPNRPDFSIDYGITRALRGLLEIETGIPKFRLSKNKGVYTIDVDKSVDKIRPYIVALVAKHGKLDKGIFEQLLAMQEDLHNGIGRRRLKASIGFHNLGPIKFPLTYKTVGEDFSFIPLGKSDAHMIREILEIFDTVKDYKDTLKQSNAFPLLVDAENNVISFPPIINSNLTRMNATANNLFVEVTGRDRNAVENLLAILAMTLYEMSFEIQAVYVDYLELGKKIPTPIMNPAYMDVRPSYINKILGLNLNTRQILRCLQKNRLGAKVQNQGNIRCTIPKYRTDILHPIDLVEEVAIGHGIDNFIPAMPFSNIAGQKSALSIYFDVLRQAMVGLGMLEVVNFSLVGSKVQYELMGIDKPDKILSVEGSKSIQHEILRDSLIPSLLQSLSFNIHEGYPQKLFEIGKIFRWSANEIREDWSIGAVIAHNNADYTEARSVLQTMLKSSFGKNVTTRASKNPIFINGRCAEILVDNIAVGNIGEITPLAIENFRIRVPVSAFELNISQLPLA
jgi:phenylalanyl-tRNA synthetase beta chain